MKVNKLDVPVFIVGIGETGVDIASRVKKAFDGHFARKQDVVSEGVFMTEYAVIVNGCGGRQAAADAGCFSHDDVVCVQNDLASEGDPEIGCAQEIINRLDAKLMELVRPGFNIGREIQVKLICSGAGSFSAEMLTDAAYMLRSIAEWHRLDLDIEALIVTPDVMIEHMGLSGAGALQLHSNWRKLIGRIDDCFRDKANGEGGRKLYPDGSSVLRKGRPFDNVLLLNSGNATGHGIGDPYRRCVEGVIGYLMRSNEESAVSCEKDNWTPPVQHVLRSSASAPTGNGNAVSFKTLNGVAADDDFRYCRLEEIRLMLDAVLRDMEREEKAAAPNAAEVFVSELLDRVIYNTHGNTVLSSYASGNTCGLPMTYGINELRSCFYDDSMELIIREYRKNLRCDEQTHLQIHEMLFGWFTEAVAEACGDESRGIGYMKRMFGDPERRLERSLEKVSSRIENICAELAGRIEENITDMNRLIADVGCASFVERLLRRGMYLDRYTSLVYGLEKKLIYESYLKHLNRAIGMLCEDIISYMGGFMMAYSDLETRRAVVSGELSKMTGPGIILDRAYLKALLESRFTGENAAQAVSALNKEVLKAAEMACDVLHGGEMPAYPAANYRVSDPEIEAIREMAFADINGLSLDGLLRLLYVIRDEGGVVGFAEKLVAPKLCAAAVTGFNDRSGALVADDEVIHRLQYLVVPHDSPEFAEGIRNYCNSFGLQAVMQYSPDSEAVFWADIASVKGFTA